MKTKYRRPMGTTLMAMNLSNQKQEESYKKEKERFVVYVIKQYINQGFQLNNKPYTLEELANLLEVSNKKLVRIMSNLRGVFFDIEDREVIKDGLGITVSKIMESTMRDRLKIEAQTERIERALNGQDYKPFISSELSKALTNNLSSQKALIDVANLLAKMGSIGPQPTNGPTINISQSQTNQSQTNYRD